MITTSSFKKDFRRDKKVSGSYEWWYFDAYDNLNNVHIVVIFYDGCPFSPDYIDKWDNTATRAEADAAEHPAVGISVYQDEKPVFYSLSEYGKSDLRWNEKKKTLHIGNSGFSMEKDGDNLIFHIMLNEVLPGGDRIRGSLKYIGEKTPDRLFGPDLSDANPAHEWNMSLPCAVVTGSLLISGRTPPGKIFNIKATGYHDHNYGAEPLKLAFYNWYWGRLHMDSGTILYYIMNKKDGFENKAWFISSDNSRIEKVFDEVELQDFRSNIFLLKSARKILLKGKNAEITIQMSTIVDSGPFYYRYICDGIFKSDAEDIIEIGHGISEYIQPARIHNKIFRSLVNMRYTFVGRKPHWVQKNPDLYRKTW
jgi:carotenoid 1,2-hydratase